MAKNITTILAGVATPSTAIRANLLWRGQPIEDAPWPCLRGELSAFQRWTLAREIRHLSTPTGRLLTDKQLAVMETILYHDGVGRGCLVGYRKLRDESGIKSNHTIMGALKRFAEIGFVAMAKVGTKPVRRVHVPRQLYDFAAGIQPVDNSPSGYSQCNHQVVTASVTTNGYSQCNQEPERNQKENHKGSKGGAGANGGGTRVDGVGGGGGFVSDDGVWDTVVDGFMEAHRTDRRIDDYGRWARRMAHRTLAALENGWQTHKERNPLTAEDVAQQQRRVSKADVLIELDHPLDAGEVRQLAVERLDDLLSGYAQHEQNAAYERCKARMAGR